MKNTVTYRKFKRSFNLTQLAENVYLAQFLNKKAKIFQSYDKFENQNYDF